MCFNGKNILILDSTDSTNNYAMALIRKGDAISGNAIMAMEQISGKGRRGKEWKSNKGANLMISIVAKMEWLAVSRQFPLSVAVALGCRDLVAHYILANVFIKWPNDIFINDRKAGGILIENVLKGTLWQWSVIGIGININQVVFEKFNLKATSLKMNTGNNYDVSKLAGEIVSVVQKRIEQLKAGEFESMLEEYNQHLFGRNRMVRLKKENIVFETKILGVSAVGQLITKSALEKRFDFDGVEFKGLVS